MNTSELERKIELFFASAREHLGHDFLRLCDAVEIDPTDIRFARLPAWRLDRLCSALNVTLDTILKGGVDFRTLRNQALGDESLPGHYLRGSLYSSRFTAVYMFNFIREHRGDVGMESILRRYQLKNSQFSDVALKNNILLPLDLCAYIQSYFGDDAVEAMGASSVKLIAKAPFSHELAQLPTAKIFLEKFFLDVTPDKIEKNINWSIDRLDNSSIQISGRLRPEVMELARDRRVDPKPLEILRKGFVRSLPTLFGGEEGHVTQLKSCSRGDLVDTYQLEFKASDTFAPLLQ